MKLVIFVLVILSYTLTVTSHGCGIHKLRKLPQQLLEVRPLCDRSMAEKPFDKLRIHLDFSSINPAQFSPDDVEAVKTIMERVKNVFEHLIKVKRIPGMLKLEANMCEDVIIPEIYRKTGVEADLVIFVKIDSTGFFLKENIEAAAIHCLQDSADGRPIAGFITFKPKLKVKDDEVALDYMSWLGVHEVTHILAFNEGLYEDFRDKNQQKLGVENIMMKTQINGSEVTLIKTPEVLEMARKHFGCDTLEGVPLEYNGGLGTAGAHWSKRYMNTDYMIGDSYGENLISKISLAILKDSGWYDVRYEQANLFLWGKDTGCSFFNKKCIEVKNEKAYTPFKNDFCTNLNEGVCSRGNIFRGICQTQIFGKSLALEKQYFSNPNEGGSDVLTDHCPIPVEDKGEQYYYGGSCRVGEKIGIKAETICPTCACFENTLQTKNSFLKERKKITYAGCFKFKCREKNVFVQISQDDKGSEYKEYLCQTGASIEVDGYEGKLKCPDNEVLCHSKYFNKFGDYGSFDNINK